MGIISNRSGLWYPLKRPPRKHGQGAIADDRRKATGVKRIYKLEPGKQIPRKPDQAGMDGSGSRRVRGSKAKASQRKGKN